MLRARAGITFLIATAVVVPALSATPPSGTLGVSAREVRWSGGPVTAITPVPDMCTATSCDSFELTINVPAAFWRATPGGVLVRTEWGDPNNDFDLYVFDENGTEVESSGQGNTNFEQLFVAAPAAGTYTVVMSGFSVVNEDYTGVAKIVEATTAPGRIRPSTMRFTPTTLVDPHYFGVEPSVWAHTDGRVFASGIAGFSETTSWAWRSEDGARTWTLLDAHLPGGLADPRRRPCTASGGGGDSDIVVDRTNRVYMTDLSPPTIAINYSADGGDTWECNAAAAQTPEEDRQWLAVAPEADGDGPNIDAYHSYRDLIVGALPGGGAVKPVQMHVDVTRDGGATWSSQGTFARGLISQSGAIFTHTDGTVYQAFYGANGVYVARSEDEGATWEQKLVSQRLADPGNVFVAADVDAAGNLYAAWVEGGTYDAMFSASLDRGETWSPPVRISPPGSETSVMPWIAAGKAGDVAVGWYGTKVRFSPDGLPEGAEPVQVPWHVWIARTLEGTGASPSFETGAATTIPMHFGSICTSGLGCDLATPPGDRSLADFFEIDILPDGAVVAVFNDNGREHPADYFPGAYTASVRQTAGLGMAASAASAASASAAARERAGDALFPRHSDAGANVAALDLRGTGVALQAGGIALLTVATGDLTNVAAALTPTNQGLATDAFWITTWRAGNHVMYVVAHYERAGGRIEFYGGIDPEAVQREPDNEVYAWYPADFDLNGSLDPSTGTMTIRLPIALYGMTVGDVMRSVQSFSSNAFLENRTMYTAPNVLDATPAVDLTLDVAAPAVLGERREAPRPVTGPPLAATGIGASIAYGLVALAGAIALAGTLRRT